MSTDNFTVHDSDQHGVKQFREWHLFNKATGTVGIAFKYSLLHKINAINGYKL